MTALDVAKHSINDKNWLRVSLLNTADESSTSNRSINKNSCGVLSVIFALLSAVFMTEITSSGLFCNCSASICALKLLNTGISSISQSSIAAARSK